ncbi:MAG: glycosyltransferase [Acidobacteria bacterium]|nr:glycosyltransferase [Acidobacteriota bacterium]MBV9477398.1 glycosyltransferase [Acidobacteriota bacterium]
MTPPRRLIVTGMHRSGTSFVASLVAAWNVRMGERFLAPDRHNPSGYFEDLDFEELDAQMLVDATPDEAGHRDWGWTESETFDAAPLPAHRDAAAALVATRDRAGGAWGWKDPRTSLLLDFWDDVLERDARYLLIYRNPWEVADSMLRTGAAVWLTHPEYAAKIWAHYNRRILEFHRRNRERTLLVSIHRLLREPGAFASIVQQKFGIDADTDTIAALRNDALFVTRPDDDPLPRLWRHAHPGTLDLLGALDDAADLGNERSWEAASRRGAPQRAERPRLSVIVPCHDDGEYLLDSVASVERTAPAAELIIVDDGSTQPRTREVLDALREAGHRVIEQPHSGLSAARNRGISASTADYVLPLDADNRVLPGFVDDAIALLDADPAAGVVYGDRREFGTRSGDVTVPELALPRMLWSNYIDACAVIRRTVWNDAGGYDVALREWEDWDFWLRAAQRGWRFARIPRPVFEYRVRPGSLHDRFLQRTDYPELLRYIYGKHRDVVSEHAAEILIAAHDERWQLFRDIELLRASRDAIQYEIDRLANAQRAEAPTNTPLTNATRVFTIIARNYLAHARVLAASLARHNPRARLQVVVFDDPQRSITDETFDVVHADELPFDPPSELFTMAAIYDVMELATAIKPWAFAHFFARGASVVIYLDPDIEVFDSLGPLETLTRAHGMLLTPHITAPLPRDGKRPDERDLLLSGVYNLGFLALSAEAANAFLPWWRAQLRRDCLNDAAEGLFVDQRWVDFAPAFFTPFVLKDPGYNVAYWNLPHRVLARDGERIVVNEQPLRFLHYSGFSPRAPHLLSKHQYDDPRVRLSEQPLLAELCARYAAALNDAGYTESVSLPYGFASTAAGLRLDARMRRVLRRTYLADEANAGARAFPNPFSREGADDVVLRLLRPAPHAPDVPAYLAELWSERADLRVAFPRLDSTDAQRFLDWVRTQGAREHDVPAELIPPRAPRAAEIVVARREQLAPGVNVYGYAFAESGTGQIVRSVVAALAAEGIQYAVVPFTRAVTRQQQAFRDLGSATPAFDTNLICVNADQVPLFFESMRAQLPRGARNIGLWAWEVEELPAAMARSERYFDEVWGISSFTAESLARRLTKPVRAFPLPVVVPPVRRRTRAELGMPDGFLFLFCFDYDSVFRRKNPLAVVAAFRDAFGDRADVALFIKTTNAGRHAAEHEELRAAAAGRASIIIRDAYVTSDDYFSMLDACDCYVSLHRSEGFGLTVAEAMALGKPVISTAYSSTLEFANESNSFPVPARLVDVGERAGPYPPRTRWAEPDVAIAAQQMARVVDDRNVAAATGARARADIETLHSPAARGPLLRRLLDESRAARAMTITNETDMNAFDPLPTSPDPPGAFEHDAMAVESLLGTPRPDLPSRMQRVATPLRRLVLRFMRVYWVQQLGVDRALLAAMRTLRRESRDEAAHLREELARLTAEVHALREHISGSDERKD